MATIIRERSTEAGLSTKGRKPFEFILPRPEPKTLGIRNPDDVEKVVNQAKQGIPFGFAGLGVYGFAGTKKGITEAARLKTEAAEALGSDTVRDLEKDPPVCLPSWQLLKTVIDWEKLAGDKFKPEELKELKFLFYHLYSRYPSHLIVPLQEDMVDLFLHSRRREMNGEETPTYAFMLTGINAELQNLIYIFEAECQSPMFVMSANPTGERSITTVKKFVQTFPEVPVLADSVMERTMTGYPSHTMFDLTELPATGEIYVLRKGSLAPALLEVALADFGWKDKATVVETPETETLEGLYIGSVWDLAGMAVDLYGWEPLKKS